MNETSGFQHSAAPFLHKRTGTFRSPAVIFVKKKNPIELSIGNLDSSHIQQQFFFAGNYYIRAITLLYPFMVTLKTRLH